MLEKCRRLARYGGWCIARARYVIGDSLNLNLQLTESQCSCLTAMGIETQVKR